MGFYVGRFPQLRSFLGWMGATKRGREMEGTAVRVGGIPYEI